MEGKALLFKHFAGVDGFPICLDVTLGRRDRRDRQRIAPVFGGINLEDIAAPECFEVEERLKELLDIPVFHDDQHGTAVVTLAALENALKIVDKKMADLKVVIAGVGAAGVAISKILLEAGVARDHRRRPQGRHLGGPRRPQRGQAVVRREHQPRAARGHAGRDAARRRRVHRRVGPRADHGGRPAHDGRPTRSCSRWPTPIPRSRPEDADGLAAVIATGRSDYPNQINNVLAFPGIFRGALDVAATSITEGMKLAAAKAIAACVSARGPGGRPHRPVGVRRAGGPAGGRGRGRGGGRRGRRARAPPTPALIPRSRPRSPCRGSAFRQRAQATNVARDGAP